MLTNFHLYEESSASENVLTSLKQHIYPKGEPYETYLIQLINQN